MKVFLNFPGQTSGDLSHDLTQQMIATRLHKTVGKHGDDLRKPDPDGQIEIPADSGGKTGVHSLGFCPGFQLHTSLEVDFVKVSER